MSEKTKGILAIIFMNLLGSGVAPFAIKIGLRTIPTLIFSEARFILSALIFLPIIFKYQNIFRDKAYPKLFLISSLGTAFNATLFAFGIKLTTATAASTIYNLTPLVVAIFGFFILKENLTKQKILGLAIGLSGTLLLIFKSSNGNPDLITSLGTLRGNLFILLAMLSWSFYLIFSKRLSQSFSASVITASSMLSASVFIFPLASLEFLKRDNFLRDVTSESLVGLVTIVLVASAFYYLFQYGTKRLPALSVSLLSLLSPFYAALVGTLLFKEEITPTLVLSGILIIIGASLSLTKVRPL